MTKPSSRPMAFAALLVACVLLSAGFFSHEHADGNSGSHDHDCIACCFPDFAAIPPAAAPTPSTPEPVACAAEATSRGNNRGATLGAPLTRGPPA